MMCEFCSSTVEFIYLLWCCTSSPGDLVPNISEQFYCPIFRDIWPLKIGPPRCSQTVSMITQRHDVVSQKNGELKILCLCHTHFSSCNFVFVFCCPVCTTNLTHHLSFFHLIALTELEDHWLWSLLLFGLFLPLLLLLCVYLNVDWCGFGGLLNFVVWDLYKLRCSCPCFSTCYYASWPLLVCHIYRICLEWQISYSLC